MRTPWIVMSVVLAVGGASAQPTNPSENKSDVARIEAIQNQLIKQAEKLSQLVQQIERQTDSMKEMRRFSEEVMARRTDLERFEGTCSAAEKRFSDAKVIGIDPKIVEALKTQVESCRLASEMQQAALMSALSKLQEMLVETKKMERELELRGAMYVDSKNLMTQLESSRALMESLRKVDESLREMRRIPALGGPVEK